MKSFNLKMSVLAVVVSVLTLGCGQGAFAVCQQPQVESVMPTTTKQTAGQKAWLKLLPKMKEYRDKRNKVYIEHVNEVRRIVRRTWRAVDTGPFVEELLGLEALFTSASPQSDVEAYISKKFSGMVIDSDQLIREIQKVYDSFDIANRKLTNDFLISVKIDVELDPRSIKACQVDTSKIRYQLSQQEAALAGQLYAASQEHLLAVGVGMAAGGLGHSLGYEMGKDQNGNATWMSTILGIAGAAATEMMAEEATLNVMDTRKKLRNSADQAVAAILEPLTGNGDKFEGCDLAMRKMLVNHRSLLLTGIAEHLLVDGKWASQHLPK